MLGMALQFLMDESRKVEGGRSIEKNIYEFVAANN